jgi:hypothetical protein
MAPLALKPKAPAAVDPSAGPHYGRRVATPAPTPSTGSRSAAYVVAGLLATIPAWIALLALGPYVATGAVVVAWSTGLVWLLKKRQEDPSWDRRPVAERCDATPERRIWRGRASS